jgi:hypothetical protein
MMLEKVVSSHSLGNGLQIQIVDASRKISGDRYQVNLIPRVDISIEP